jgi:hypothetical protein
MRILCAAAVLLFAPTMTHAQTSSTATAILDGVGPDGRHIIVSVTQQTQGNGLATTLSYIVRNPDGSQLFANVLSLANADFTVQEHKQRLLTTTPDGAISLDWDATDSFHNETTIRSIQRQNGQIVERREEENLSRSAHVTGTVLGFSLLAGDRPAHFTHLETRVTH